MSKFLYHSNFAIGRLESVIIPQTVLYNRRKNRNARTSDKLNIIMKKKSLKVQLREIAQAEMRNLKGGQSETISDSDTKLKTVTVTGKKKNISSLF